MKKILFLSLLSTAVFFQTYAQESKAAKWGKVLPQELSMKSYHKDTSAAAVVLSDYGILSVNVHDFSYSLTRHRRIKILKKGGIQYGDVTIPYYRKDGMERITRIQGTSFAPNGDKVVLKKNAIFDEEINQFWSQKKISFPNVQEGSVLEYRYQVISKDIFELYEWVFQEEIPVVYSEYKVEIPNGLSYVYLFQGAKQMTRTADPNTLLYQGEATVTLDGNRYVMENVPALKEEAFLTTLTDYTARLRFQLSEISYSDGSKKRFMKDWPDIAQEFLDYSTFGEQIERQRNFKDLWAIVAPQIEAMQTDEEVMQFIYKFVQNNMTWNGVFRLRVKEDLDDLYEKKTASVAGINLMLVALLNAAEITAHPVLSSTRSHGMPLPNNALVDQFNYVLAYADVEGKKMLLDATHPLLPAGMLPVNALNKEAWIVTKNPKWIDIKPATSEDIFLVNMNLSEEGEIDGDIQAVFKGHSAINERSACMDDKEGVYWQKRLGEKFESGEIADFKIESLQETGEPFINEFNFNISNAALVAGDFLYISPILYSNFSKNPLKQEKRYYPVDIPYPFKEKYILKLQLPDNYEVEEIPQSAKLVLPNGGGSIRYVAEQKENMLEILYDVNLKQIYFQANEYPTLKKFFDLATEKQEQQIVLKRKG